MCKMKIIPAIILLIFFVKSNCYDGRKVRARDLIKYLETYVGIFNGATLPDPGMVFTVRVFEFFFLLLTKK